MKIVKCQSDYNMMRFNWHLLDWCNYKCSYCSVGDAITNDFSDTTRISQDYKLTLARLGTVSDKFELCLTGGEPTLHPNFFEILDSLVEIKNLQRVWLFSNLSRSKDFLLQVKEYFPKIVLYGSWHPEFSKDDFLTKAIELDCEVHVSLVNDKAHWDKTKKLIDELIENNVTYRLNALQPTVSYQPDHGPDFEEAFLHYLENAHDTFGIKVTYEDGHIEQHTEHTLQIQNLNFFKGYYCVPASYQIRLDGTIVNVCTSEKMPISLSGINKKIKCPVNECLEGLLMYPKELEDVS